MYCEKCGSDIRTSNFCYNCGAPAFIATPITAYPQQNQLPLNHYAKWDEGKPQRKKNKKRNNHANNANTIYMVNNILWVLGQILLLPILFIVSVFAALLKFTK